MELLWYHYVLAIAAGLIAGVINTLAGSGSLVTLPLLVFLGLPAPVANGTNRIGVLVQTTIGFFTLQKHKKYKHQTSAVLIIPCVIGAVLGAWIAVDINEEMMNKLIGSLMVFMLIVLMVDPKRWLKSADQTEVVRHNFLLIPVFFFIGIYGGLIQAGVGIFLLSALVLLGGYDMVRSNALKLLIVLLYSIPAILVFMYNDQINWGLGLLVAVGQGGGGWLGARFAALSPNAPIWIRRLLILIILVSIVKFFDLL